MMSLVVGKAPVGQCRVITLSNNIFGVAASVLLHSRAVLFGHEHNNCRCR